MSPNCQKISQNRAVILIFFLPLIECLIRGDCHHDLVPDTEQKETSFRQIERNLTDDLIEALREKLLSDRADSTFSSLALHKLLVKHFSQTSYINSAGWLMAHILDPVLAYTV